MSKAINTSIYSLFVNILPYLPLPPKGNGRIGIFTSLQIGGSGNAIHEGGGKWFKSGLC